MSTDTTNGHLQIDDYQGRVFTYSSMERVLYSPIVLLCFCMKGIPYLFVQCTCITNEYIQYQFHHQLKCIFIP